ncbi:MAG TPA: VC0807 family protein [Mycobacteriales bacterium]|nr:VC0807 family protein [Mycobacteriales bacterium]
MTGIGHRVPARAAEQFAERPGLRAVLRHLGLNLFVATIVPTALFYACLITAGLWAALIVALMWCYATLAWRLRRRQPTSVLLWLTVAGLTGKTVLAFATGSTFIYFVQPAVGDALVAFLFLLSLATARPAVARLAGEFYPMTKDVAARRRVQTLFSRLTLLWAGICATKAGVMLLLLHSLTLTSFVMAKTVFAPSAAALGAAITIVLALRVARREGLLPAPAA